MLMLSQSVTSDSRISLSQFGEVIEGPGGKVIGFRVTALHPDLHAAGQLLQQLYEAQDAIQWVAGDLLNAGQIDRDAIYQYMDACAQTITNWAFICRHIPVKWRREMLDFSKHQVAAIASGALVKMPGGKLKPLTVELLDAAESHLLTVVALRKLRNWYLKDTDPLYQDNRVDIYPWLDPMGAHPDEHRTISLSATDRSMALPDLIRDRVRDELLKLGLSSSDKIKVKVKIEIEIDRNDNE